MWNWGFLKKRLGVQREDGTGVPVYTEGRYGMVWGFLMLDRKITSRSLYAIFSW